jgi:hypothetical protein
MAYAFIPPICNAELADRFVAIMSDLGYDATMTIRGRGIEYTTGRLAFGVERPIGEDK